MAKAKITLGVTGDGINIYAMPSGGKDGITNRFFKLSGTDFDSLYFKSLKTLLAEYFLENRALIKSADIALVLPDSLIASDVIDIPAVRGSNAKSMLNASLKSLYKNLNELKVNASPLSQDKYTVSYTVAIIRAALLENFKKVCTAAKLNISAVTFASSAAVNAVLAINPRLKNADFLLLDIKQNASVFVFVNKGRAAGSYRLPFGSGILSDSEVTQENLLFNHAAAEIAVINAQERAKAKKSTEDMPILSLNDEPTDQTSEGTAKKPPRFLQRPTPGSRLDYVYENFRIFEKWTLNLIRSNEALVAAGKPEAVFVNIGGDHSELFDKINAEKEINGITFNRLDTHGERGIITENLEYYGGFFTSLYNKNNNF